MAGFKYWLQRGSYSMINRLIAFFFGFGAYLILVRYFDKGTFGVYNIYVIITTFVEMSRNSFLQNAFIKHFLNEKYDKNEVYTATLLLNLIYTAFFMLLLWSLAGLIGTTYDSEALTSMIIIYSLSSLVMVPYSQAVFYFNALLNFKVITIMSFMRYGGYFFAILVVWLGSFNVGLVEVAWMNAGAVLLGALVSFLFGKLMEHRAWQYSLQVLKDVFNFGKYIFGVGITSILTRSTDQLMIGYFISSEAVASYNVAGRFMNFIEIPLSSLSQLIYPKFASTVNDPNPKAEQQRLFEKSVGTILAVIAPFILVIFLFPSIFIIIVAGEQYLDAIPILQVLIAFNLLKPFATQSGALLEVSGKPKVGFYALLVSTVMNILLNYILIQMDGPAGGMMGAAIASVLSGSAFLILVLQSVYKECKFSIIKVVMYIWETYMVGLNQVLKKIRK